MGRIGICLGLFALGAAALGATCAGPAPAPPAAVQALQALPDASLALDYDADVRPVLEHRCVVCHSCYDAPCQLLLSSFSGLERGASKEAVYHSDRLRPAEPTRLFVDAQTTAAWRQRGFFSVLDPDPETAASGALLRMLALGREAGFAPDAPLPDDVPLAIGRKLSCPAPDELDAYAREHPHGGMPYGMAPLAPAELGALAGWAARPGPPPRPVPLAPDVARQVETWEAFLNGTSLEERVVARYLYEHWFLAHLYFDSHPSGPFFEIVRSSAPPGAPIVPIATRRPYDDPGVAAFWYRLRPIESTIVHKTHVVYALGETRLARLRELFLDGQWRATRFPSWTPEEASNPFVSFDQLPPRSRYLFLLDDAWYFIMTFIRGPVCHGQTATDVIEDRFWVTFLDPDYDVSIADTAFLDQAKDLLRLPAEKPDAPNLLAPWLEYGRAQRKYLDLRAKAYAAYYADGRGASLDFLWDGYGHDRDALLTVLRNYDNATVIQGFVGATPKTAWVLDFPVFERIYYDLVAGFDVFGNVTHQISTRLYMDHLRMQSEDLFLAFLPSDRREEIRASWYVGATKQLDYFRVDRLRSLDRETEIHFTTADPKAELLARIRERNAAVAGPPDLLNRCARPACDRAGATATERRAERALHGLAGVRGPWVAPLPEVMLLRVRGAGADPDALYTLFHDRAHTNVAFLFGEDERLVPGDDVLTLVPGVVASYPNFAFDVPAAEIEAFASALRGVPDAAGLAPLVQRWGLRRTSPRFWSTLDAIQAWFTRREPTQAGLLDLNRYQNL